MISISVIVPVYNRAHLIARTLRSVYGQTIEPTEVIIVDDGSTDDLESALLPFTGQYRLIRCGSNKGGGHARQLGVQHAAGEWIAFIDADDEWVPQKLEKQIALMSSWASGEASDQNLVIYSRLWEMPAGKVSGELKSPLVTVAEYLFIMGGMLQTSSLLLRRELLQKIPFRDIPKHQDWDLCLRLDLAGVQFVGVDEPLVIWHQDHAGRVSRKNSASFSRRWVSGTELQVGFRPAAAFLVEVVADQYASGSLGQRLVCCWLSLKALIFCVRPIKAIRTLARAIIRW